MDWQKKLQDLMKSEQEKAVFCLNKTQLKHRELEQHYKASLKRLASLKRKLKQSLSKIQSTYPSTSGLSHSDDDELSFLKTHLKMIKQELRLLEINEISLTRRITSLNQWLFSAEESWTNTSSEEKYQEITMHLQQCDQNFPLFAFQNESPFDLSRSHAICQ